MFKVEFDDGDFKKKIEEMLEDLGKIDGAEIPLGKLFNPRFMGKYTDFETFDTMVEASGFNVETEEDFEAIPDAEWDRFVDERTQFTSWEEMMDMAAKKWAEEELGL